MDNLIVDSGYSKEREAMTFAQARRLEEDFQSCRPLRELESISGPLPLSQIQLSMVLTQAQFPESAVYNSGVFFDVRGPIDEQALCRAMQALVRRYPILRLRIEFLESGIVGHLHPTTPFVPELLETPSMKGDLNRARSFMATQLRQPIDLERDRLFRLFLIKVSENSSILGLHIHHIVWDGRSRRIMTPFFCEAYNIGISGTSDTHSYAAQTGSFDWAVSQAFWLAEGKLEDSISWWRKQLVDIPPPAELPYDHPYVFSEPVKPRIATRVVSRDTVDRLKRVGETAGASFFSVLMSACFILLDRFSEGEELVVGFVADNRRRESLKDVLGPLINTLPLRSRIHHSDTILTIIKRIVASVMESIVHQDVPVETIIEQLNPDRDARGNPFYNVVFNYQREPFPQLNLKNCETVAHVVPPDLDRLALAIESRPCAEGLEVCFHAGAALFEQETVERLLDRYLKVLEFMIDDHDLPIGQTDWFIGDEISSIQSWSRGPVNSFPRDGNLHRVFESRVEEAPHAIAVSEVDGKVTREELNASANRLARAMINMGLSSGDHIAISINRSVDFVASLLGIIKAGAAYMPLEQEIPGERLSYLLEDADARFFLCEDDYAVPQLPEGCRLVRISELKEAAANESASNLEWTGHGNDVVNIMYTSGSTGSPKGIEILHRNILRLVCGASHNVMQEGDVCNFSSPVGFDASTWEIWAPMLNGGEMAVFPSGVHGPADLKRFIAQFQVTHLSLTTAHLHLIIEEDVQALRNLCLVITGGEALRLDLARKFAAALPEVNLVNCYGPTENTTDTTCFLVDSYNLDGVRSVPIGRPVANTVTLVLDDRNRLCPVGIPGELYIGGEGLARGYLNRPELTEASFVHIDSNLHEGRLYRSGDRVRWLPSGNLEFLGRLDDQVKIRGFRIEPAEVEAAMIAQSFVESAAVVVDRSAHELPKLLAAVVLNADADVRSLEEALSRKLPSFMIPTVIAPVDSIPLNSAGKIDRTAVLSMLRALPLRTSGSKDTDRELTEEERAVASIWKSVLDVSEVKHDDSLFSLGGHSLALIRIRSRIQSQLGVDVPISVFFQTPVLSEMAEFIRLQLPDKGEAIDALSPRTGSLPSSGWFESSNASGRPGSFVTIRSTGSREPLIGAYGHAYHSSPYIWGRMAEFLSPDQPVYGLLGNGLDGSRIDSPDLASLARAHAQSILPIVEKTGCTLAGYCMGGRLAYEVLYQLQQLGVAAEHIILVDTLTPSEEANLLRLKSRNRWKSLFNYLLKGQVTPMVKKVSDSLRMRLMGHRDRRRLSDIHTTASHASETTIPEDQRSEYMMAAHERIFETFNPKPVKGRLDLIRSVDAAFGNKDGGWTPYVDGEIKVHVAELPHQMMLHEEISQVASLFNRILSRDE